MKQCALHTAFIYYLQPVSTMDPIMAFSLVSLVSFVCFDHEIQMTHLFSEHTSTMASRILDNTGSLHRNQPSIRCVGVRRRAVVEQRQLTRNRHQRAQEATRGGSKPLSQCRGQTLGAVSQLYSATVKRSYLFEGSNLT